MFDKKKKNFKSLDSLEPVVNVVNDAALAINDPSRTITKSPLSPVLTGALGAGAGGAISFTALYSLGVTGLSAAGITSALAAAGMGAGMTAGIFVLAAPVAVLAATGVGVASARKYKQLQQEKERLLKAAIEKHHAIVSALNREIYATKQRADYLNSLNILLQQAIKDLQADLGTEVA